MYSVSCSVYLDEIFKKVKRHKTRDMVVESDASEEKGQKGIALGPGCLGPWPYTSEGTGLQKTMLWQICG